MRSPPRGISSCGELFFNLLAWGCEQAWKGFTLYLPCGQPYILFFLYFKGDILLHANCARCVNYCIQVGLQAGMEGFHPVFALQLALHFVFSIFQG